MFVLLALLAAHTVCSESPLSQSRILQDDSVLEVGRADFHAYENAWSVSFTHALDAHAFDLLVFELCRPPCAASSGAALRPQNCQSLASRFQEPGWRNDYMSSRANASAQLCADIHSASEAVQTLAGHVLSDASGGALVRLRAPLVLVLYNEDALVKGWMSLGTLDTLSLHVRVSYVTALQTHFLLRHSVLRIQLRRPVKAVLTLGLQNPCTAVGLSAPDFGSVSSVNVSGRQRCVWNCREDRIRMPYNSAPPTADQLNASHPAYALLDVKYECLPPPVGWTATVFGFSLETATLPSDSGYAQSLFDAIDRLAEGVRQNLLADGEGIVLLSVIDALYHPIPFEEYVQRLRLANCADADCGALAEIDNPGYIYQRRRLLSEVIQSLRVEGVLIAPQKQEAISEQERVQERVQEVQEIRATLQSAIERNVELVSEQDSSLLIKSVMDVDVAKILVSEETGPAVLQEEDEGLASLLAMALAAGGVLVLLTVLASAVVLTPSILPRNYNWG
jgi:hypothetical protein